MHLSHIHTHTMGDTEGKKEKGGDRVVHPEIHWL